MKILVGHFSEAVTWKQTLQSRGFRVYHVDRCSFADDGAADKEADGGRMTRVTADVSLSGLHARFRFCHSCCADR